MDERIFNAKLFLYDEPELDKDIEFFQNDTKTCVINIELFKDRKTPYYVDGSVAILINKNDGNVVVDVLTKVDEGKYTYKLPNSAINVVGSHKVTVQCNGIDNNRITFISFKYKVKSDVSSGDISSESEFPVLTKLLSDNQVLNNEFNMNENERIINENRRIINEEKRLKDYEEASKEYDSYRNVMIAESNVAALQSQINNNNAQLAEKTQQINDLDTNKANEVDLVVERKRIDQFTKLQEGSTTGDAELVDGRVGADGITYSNIGGAIRKQIEGVTDKVIDLYTIGKNLYNIKKATDGYYVSETDGTVKKGDSYTVSSFIEIKENAPHIISYTNSKSPTGLRWALYDSGQKFLKGALENFSVPVTVNAKYIKFSYITTRETVQLEEGTVETPYVAFGKTLAIPVVVDDTLGLKGMPSDSKVVGDRLKSMQESYEINALRKECIFNDNIAKQLSSWSPLLNATWETNRWKVSGNGYINSTVDVVSGGYYIIEIQKDNVINQDPNKLSFFIEFDGTIAEIFGNSDYNFIYSQVFMATKTGNISVKVGSNNWNGEITDITIRKIHARPTLPFKINGIETRMALNNIACGNGHLYLTTGISNTAFGLSAQKNLDTGTDNSAFGYGVQNKLKGGSFNNGFGKNAQGELTSGMYNNAIGTSAQAKMTTGCWNNAIGNEAQRDVTSGCNNVSMGRRAHNSLTTGNGNVAIGARAGFYPKETITADYQTLVGFQASQYTNEKEDYLTAIGFQASGRKYATAIGSNSSAEGIGSVAIGVDGNGVGSEALKENEFVLGTEKHNVKIKGTLNLARYTPTSSTDSRGQIGDITSDDNYIYTKTSTGWKRSPLSTW